MAAVDVKQKLAAVMADVQADPVPQAERLEEATVDEALPEALCKPTEQAPDLHPEEAAVPPEDEDKRQFDTDDEYAEEEVTTNIPLTAHSCCTGGPSRRDNITGTQRRIRSNQRLRV